MELKSDSALHRQNLAGAYYQLGDFEKAIEQYKEAIRLDPNGTWYYIQIGNSYFNQ